MMLPYACTEVTIPRLSSPKNHFCSHNTVVVNAHVDGRTCEGLISLLTTSIADHTPVVVRTFNDAVSPAHSVTIPQPSPLQQQSCGHSTDVVSAHIDPTTCEGLKSTLTTGTANRTPVILMTTFYDSVRLHKSNYSTTVIS
jgi:hypothetical protein